MSAPFGSRTTLQAEERIWKALEDFDWVDAPASASAAAAPVQRIAWDMPDDDDEQICMAAELESRRRKRRRCLILSVLCSVLLWMLIMVALAFTTS